MAAWVKSFDHVGDEASIDLQFVNRQRRKVAQRRLPGTKVVDAQAYAHAFEFNQDGAGSNWIAHEHGLGHFDEQARMFNVCGIHRGDDLVRETYPIEASRRDIHCHDEVVRTGPNWESSLSTRRTIQSVS